MEGSGNGLGVGNASSSSVVLVDGEPIKTSGVGGNVSKSSGLPISGGVPGSTGQLSEVR